MAPRDATHQTGVLFENDKIEEVDTKSESQNAAYVTQPKPVKKYKRQLVWRNIIIFGLLHLAAVYGLFLVFTRAKLLTNLWALFLYYASGLGITAGAHRLWSHRAYKAKWPLRLILVIFNTMAHQNHVYEWSRDHRVHHKYSETNADPHNAKRGFFFSHVGWLLTRKHPEVIEKGKQLDMSDLEADPLVAFQKKHYKWLMPLFCFVLPAVVPVVFWGESWYCAFYVASLFRYTVVLNMTWLVNSAAHMWGDRPYDQYINPAENKGVAMMAFGEGWHNYHHVFPWDYKTAELGDYTFNVTTAFIDFFAKIGWAYDLKTVSVDTIQKRAKRTGDGSHAVWGWGDKDLPTNEAGEALTINEKSE